MKACLLKINSVVRAGAVRLPVFFCALTAVALAAVLLPGLAGAARVTDLYGAVGELADGSRGQLNRAFDDALGQVLVKVSGLPELASPAARRSLVPDSASIVQQYGMLPDNKVRVDFDPLTIRTALDRAGQPVWGDERPLVAIWVAVDAGGGRRFVLSEGAAADAAVEQTRAELLAIAQQRGLPVVLPLADAEDLRNVSFSDLWGDFREPVVAASARYGAKAVLIGRTRSLNSEQQGVRWTLVAGNEQASWQGNLAGGPAYAAEFLAKRLATYANSAGALRVLITNVDSLDAYGQLNNYFRSLNIVDSATISRVDGDRVEFELIVRGDAARLGRTLDTSAQLQPVAEQAVGGPVVTGRLPDLVYVWTRQP